jgi:hypothetical protein
LTLTTTQLHDVAFRLITLYSVMSRYHFTIDFEEHIASIFKIKVSQVSKQGSDGRGMGGSMGHDR